MKTVSLVVRAVVDSRRVNLPPSGLRPEIFRGRSICGGLRAAKNSGSA